MVKNLPLLFIISLICGCSSPRQSIIADSLDEIPVVTGSVADPSVFEKGGTLALGSFKAGVGAAADDQTDQLSSMMIKGIRDTLPAENTHFTIASDDQNDSSDVYLEGYIENYGSKGHLAQLSVDGNIWLRETGEKILLFQTSVVIDLKTQNPKAVAYQVGTAIAHFIGSKS